MLRYSPAIHLRLYRPTGLFRQVTGNRQALHQPFSTEQFLSPLFPLPGTVFPLSTLAVAMAVERGAGMPKSQLVQKSFRLLVPLWLTAVRRMGVDSGANQTQFKRSSPAVALFSRETSVASWPVRRLDQASVRLFYPVFDGLGTVGLGNLHPGFLNLYRLNTVQDHQRVSGLSRRRARRQLQHPPVMLELSEQLFLR